MAVSPHVYLPVFVLLTLSRGDSQVSAVTNNSNCSSTDRSDKTETLHLLALTPYPDPNATGIYSPLWSGGPGIVPAIRLAVDLINERSDILANYTLDVIEGDSGCRALSMKGLISYTREVIHGKRSVVGVIGPACSEVALQFEPFMGHRPLHNRPRTLQVHIGTSPELTNRTRYPYLFSTVSSTSQFNITIRNLSLAAGWNRLGLLYDGLAPLYFSLLEYIAGSENAVEFTSAIYETYFPLEHMRDSHLRVFIVLTPPKLTQMLMCLAYWEGFTYPKFQFIFLERTVQEFRDSEGVSFEYEEKSYTCDSSVLIKAIKGSILLQYTLRTNKSRKDIISNLSYSDYERMYRSKVDDHEKELNMNISNQPYATVYYDAVWAMALALNSSIAPLVEMGLSLSDYKSGMVGIQQNITDVVRKQLIESVHFNGISGEIDFDPETGHVETSVRQVQVDEGEEVSIVLEETAGSLFANGSFISDSFETRYERISTATFAVFVTSTVVQSIVAIALHVLNVVYRKYKSIKASSPALNHLMFLGCYLLVITLIERLFIGYFPDRDSLTGKLLCSTGFSVGHLGMTLILATIFIKTWRIYRIFVHCWRDPGDHLKNRVLVMKITFLVVPVLLYCIIKFSIAPLELSSEEELRDGDDLPYLERTVKCKSHWYDIAGLRLYEMSLLLFALYFSIATRNVQQAVFQSTRSISSLTYCLILLFSITIPLYLIAVLKSWPLDLFYSVQYVELSGALFVCILFGLFPPVVFPVKEKFQGMMRRTRSSRKSHHVSFMTW